MIAKTLSRLAIMPKYAFCELQKDRELKQKIENDITRRMYDYLGRNLDQTIENLNKFRDSPVFVERNEIETRIRKRLFDSELVDLKTFNFHQDMRNELNLDSLNITVLLTEIQHEFTTVFEDRVFESVRRLSEIVDILARDEKIF